MPATRLHPRTSACATRADSHARITKNKIRSSTDCFEKLFSYGHFQKDPAFQGSARSSFSEFKALGSAIRRVRQDTFTERVKVRQGNMTANRGSARSTLSKFLAFREIILLNLLRGVLLYFLKLESGAHRGLERVLKSPTGTLKPAETRRTSWRRALRFSRKGHLCSPRQTLACTKPWLKRDLTLDIASYPWGRLDYIRNSKTIKSVSVSVIGVSETGSAKTGSAIESVSTMQGRY